ncbi:alpha-amylase family protein [Leptolyngbya sp. FACHB-711]|uniref:alpha-amylase family protein n=1 Tax=unclassified Leptolyngbya TaxID=2650499 RepID=UPI001689620E|nr:alpha-amylase family protein [Leptolyngbya sp. FACHB-711]MBD1851805.1 trehalose synthase [Cyanobacteria bacterium FACHB-502]MBD2026132.1 trehalose synthase [Leptolyngbya sp. FACHB-711]
MLDLWYKNTIIYCLDVETFRDSDGDGVGDFPGLTECLDYLSGLGITCIWLMPFYPSPNRDNGYDVTDYYNVDSRLGTLGDFVEFTRQANHRGIRVIVDLVVNHTSTEHPWFQAACSDQQSKYRDYYVWKEKKPEDADEGIVFPGRQSTTWTYQEQAQAFYHHRFYEHQADLNIANPTVRQEICKIMGFWLQLGVSGFRVDAAPYLIELQGVEDQADVTDPFTYLSEFRDFLSWRRGDAIVLAEANISIEEMPKYFGNGDRMQMLFGFIVNQQMMLSLVREEAAPLVNALKSLPPIPQIGQWAIFVRNHDELSLDKLTPAEQEEVADQFAPDREQMWIFDRGIRRRLPPMVEGNIRRIQLAYSLMLTLPGTPVLFYGEEIGMGEDLSLDERNSTRTPMQWSDAPNGGFSTAPSEKLIRPVISEGQFGYAAVNVMDQRRDPKSLLNWMERAIRMRKECPEFGWGKWQILDTGKPQVFAHRCEWQKGAVVALHNLSSQPCTVTLSSSPENSPPGNSPPENLPENDHHWLELLGDCPYEPLKGASREIYLESYGFRWFRVCSRGA